MFETVKKFVMDHKIQIVRAAIIVGGGLLGAVGAALLGNEDQEEIVEPTPVSDNPATEDPTI